MNEGRRSAAALEVRGVPDHLRTAIAWAWCRVLAVEEDRYIACVRLLEDQQREIRRLQAELDSLRARAGAGRE